MRGNQLYKFLSQKLVPGQVIHISSRNGYHTFANVNAAGSLRFRVPNIQNPQNPYFKNISKRDIIKARNKYNLNKNVPVNRNWILLNIGENWKDCRVALLRNLLRMPECLK